MVDVYSVTYVLGFPDDPGSTLSELGMILQ